MFGLSQHLVATLYPNLAARLAMIEVVPMGVSELSILLSILSGELDGRGTTAKIVEVI